MQRAGGARGGGVLFPGEVGVVAAGKGAQPGWVGGAAGDSWSQGTGNPGSHPEPGSILGGNKKPPGVKRPSGHNSVPTREGRPTAAPGTVPAPSRTAETQS